MKVTKMRKVEFKELSPEEYAAELKRMEAHKGKMTISFEGNAAEEKLAKKYKAPFVMKTLETVVVE